MLSNLRSLESQLLRQQLATSRMSLRPESSGEEDDGAEDVEDDNENAVEPSQRLGFGSNFNQRALTMNNIRKLRNNFRKRNYNLDHLARMNFRRSFRASSFNNRHILGGL